jgi:hypothetical protein
MKTEPVLTAAALAGIIVAGLSMAVSLGWLRLTPEQMQSVQAFILPLAALLLPVGAAFYARSKVTPTAAPRTPDGKAAVIVPASLISPEIKAAATPAMAAQIAVAKAAK